MTVVMAVLLLQLLQLVHHGATLLQLRPGGGSSVGRISCGTRRADDVSMDGRRVLAHAGDPAAARGVRACVRVYV